MRPVQATARLSRALHATADLLTRLRLDFAFVGHVARAAWLGRVLDRGPIDVIALLYPEQKGQVAMMASHRGFHVDREEIDASEELDLIPLHFLDDEEGNVRVHVLVATNALYGRMFGAAAETTLDEQTVRIVSREDLALLLSMSEDAESRLDLRSILAAPEFDRDAYNRKVVSIGLGELVVAE